MAWTHPPDRSLVTAAGGRLRTLTFPISDEGTLGPVNAWRSSHSYPLNLFQTELRRRARLICGDAIVAQRIKRLESIHQKLVDRPTMRMTQMQDIGGCRAVVGNVSRVNKLCEVYFRGNTARFAHHFHHEKNYIDCPKLDGYRSRHLVYQYGSRSGSPWDGLHIEIQIRTKLQHAWATAVESVGTFTRTALKSNRGDERWRRFFVLMSTAIAAIEKCPSVDRSAVDKALLCEEVRDLEAELGVLDGLVGYQTAIRVAQKEGDRLAGYYVLILKFDERVVEFAEFRKTESADALSFAADYEKSIAADQNVQVVLVAAGSVRALTRAYPNYFLDTAIFVDVVRRVLRGEFPNPQPIGTRAC